MIFGTRITKTIGHRQMFLFSHLTYLVQLLYLGKLSGPRYQQKLTKIIKISQEDVILIKNLSVKAVWCMDSVEWIAWQWLETWKHRQCAEENPQDGYNCAATRQWQTAFSVQQWVTLCSVRRTSQKDIGTQCYSSWDFVWNCHSLFKCTQENIHGDHQFTCFKQRRAQLLSEANRISRLIRW